MQALHPRKTYPEVWNRRGFKKKKKTFTFIYFYLLINLFFFAGVRGSCMHYAQVADTGQTAEGSLFSLSTL